MMSGQGTIVCSRDRSPLRAARAGRGGRAHAACGSSRPSSSDCARRRPSRIVDRPDRTRSPAWRARPCTRSSARAPGCSTPSAASSASRVGLREPRRRQAPAGRARPPARRLPRVERDAGANRDIYRALRSMAQLDEQAVGGVVRADGARSAPPAMTRLAGRLAEQGVLRAGLSRGGGRRRPLGADELRELRPALHGPACRSTPWLAADRDRGASPYDPANMSASSSPCPCSRA